VEELYAAGVVDGVEEKALLAPIEKRERMLQRRGAVWRTPRVMDVRGPGRARPDRAWPQTPWPCHLRCSRIVLWHGPPQLRWAQRSAVRLPGPCLPAQCA